MPFLFLNLFHVPLVPLLWLKALNCFWSRIHSMPFLMLLRILRLGLWNQNCTVFEVIHDTGVMMFCVFFTPAFFRIPQRLLLCTLCSTVFDLEWRWLALNLLWELLHFAFSLLSFIWHFKIYFLNLMEFLCHSSQPTIICTNMWYHQQILLLHFLLFSSGLIEGWD